IRNFQQANVESRARQQAELDRGRGLLLRAGADLRPHRSFGTAVRGHHREIQLQEGGGLASLYLSLLCQKCSW
ncbi:hypothetical protein AVEN_207380-1, partial [Araneus ventricosus]